MDTPQIPEATQRATSVFRRARACKKDCCVEVGADGRALVRDSALPDSPVLAIDAASWQRLTRQLRAS